MSATNYNIIIDQGANWFINFLYKDTGGVAVNLTGYTAALQIRQTYASTTTLLSLTSSPAAGITITAGTGTIAITATAAQTGAIAAGTYVYDCEITDGTGVVTRIVQGQIQVSPEVTR
jgi:hypothetical protein